MENKMRISTRKGSKTTGTRGVATHPSGGRGQGENTSLKQENSSCGHIPVKGEGGGYMFLEHGQTLTATLLVWIVTARRLQKMWRFFAYIFVGVFMQLFS